MTEFKDHFSTGSEAYALHRPRYPDPLFDWLAGSAPGRALAVDAATGSGQAALGLAAHFDRVVALDASASQLAHAAPHPRVEYRVGRAEASGLPDAVADLVTVAQALHWLDVPAFWREVRRVLRPGGVVAAWGYALPAISPAIDALIDEFSNRTLASYWPPERRILDERYETVEFPFEPLAAPPFAIELEATLDEYLDYLRTWSAVRRWTERHGGDPVTALAGRLAPHWRGRRRIVWSLALRAGRVPGG
jgi:ubiquinone/menaquinone biosynthesis C-methylase UbiE